MSSNPIIVNSGIAALAAASSLLSLSSAAMGRKTFVVICGLMIIVTCAEALDLIRIPVPKNARQITQTNPYTGEHFLLWAHPSYTGPDKLHCIRRTVDGDCILPFVDPRTRELVTAPYAKWACARESNQPVAFVQITDDSAAIQTFVISNRGYPDCHLFFSPSTSARSEDRIDVLWWLFFLPFTLVYVAAVLCAVRVSCARQKTKRQIDAHNNGGVEDDEEQPYHARVIVNTRVDFEVEMIDQVNGGGGGGVFEDRRSYYLSSENTDFLDE